MLLNNEIRIAEVYFFVLLRSLEDQDHEVALALISLFSDPDPTLLRLSVNMLWSCEYQGDAALRFIDIRSIQAVVAMVPHSPAIDGREAHTQFFLVEKPGLDVTVIAGADDEDESVDVDENPNPVEMQGI